MQKSESVMRTEVHQDWNPSHFQPGINTLSRVFTLSPISHRQMVMLWAIALFYEGRGKENASPSSSIDGEHDNRLLNCLAFSSLHLADVLFMKRQSRNATI